MSGYKKSSYGDSSRRHGSSSSRRDSSPPRRSRRSPSPGSSRDRSPKPRDPKNLPESFGRIQENAADDDLNILQRMKTSYINSPLNDLYKCVKEEIKVKIWTRNYKEVRGILSGYVIAFDKHWNLILRDVDEVYLMPKKSKTPFLRDVEPDEDLPDMPAKVPRQKRAEGAPAPIVPKKEKSDDEKKKRRKKKSKKTSEKRNVGKIFVRGDNIVMICPLNDDDRDSDEAEAEGEAEAEVEEEGNQSGEE